MSLSFPGHDVITADSSTAVGRDGSWRTVVFVSRSAPVAKITTKSASPCCGASLELRGGLTTLPRDQYRARQRTPRQPRRSCTAPRSAARHAARNACGGGWGGSPSAAPARRSCEGRAGKRGLRTVGGCLILYWTSSPRRAGRASYCRAWHAQPRLGLRRANDAWFGGGRVSGGPMTKRGRAGCVLWAPHARVPLGGDTA